MEILWTCGEDDEGRVVKDIARKRLHLSGALWKRIKWNGIFSLNGEALHNAKTPVKAGDVLRFSWSEESDIVPSDIPLDILYEDKELLIVNKGPGMIIHPTSKEAHDTLVNAVAGYFQKKGEESGIHPVYRLDRNTTGIVVVAKSAKGQYELSKSHDVLYREYLALVSGNMEGEGTRWQMGGHGVQSAGFIGKGKSFETSSPFGKDPPDPGPLHAPRSSPSGRYPVWGSPGSHGPAGTPCFHCDFSSSGNRGEIIFQGSPSGRYETCHFRLMAGF